MRKILCALCLLSVFLLVFTASAEQDGITVKEEDGGEFRPLPVSLEGGSPLPFTYKYNQKLSFYEDPTIRVDRYRVDHSEWGVTYWYADITIRDPSQIRTAAADENTPFTGSAMVPGTVIAKRKKAVLAVDGDYCASFSGQKPPNYILRQGTVYRDIVTPNLEILLIDEDGDFHVVRPAGTDLETLDKTTVDGKKVINALQFGPALVLNGEPVPDEVVLDYDRSPTYSEPDRRAQRMCICQIDKLRYRAVSCANYGTDLATFRDLVMSLGPVQTAYMLDGGESSQMVFLGHRINTPNSSNGKDRGLTDAIYFASAWFTD